MAEQEQGESGFVIDGNTYPIPALDTFDMDEAQVLYDYAGCVLEDFAPAHPEWSEEEKQKWDGDQLAKVRNPAFKRALLHVAYARGNPDLKVTEVREAIGKANALDVTVTLFAGDDAGPPEQTESSPSELSNGRSSSTPSNPTASGPLLSRSSDQPDEIPEPTGTSESDTSSIFDAGTSGS